MKLKRKRPAANTRTHRDAILARGNCLPTHIYERDEAIKSLRDAGVGIPADIPTGTALMPVTLPHGWRIVESPEVGAPLYLKNERGQGVAVINFVISDLPLLIVYGLPYP